MAQSCDPLRSVRRLGAPGMNAVRMADQAKRQPALLEAIIGAAGSDSARTRFGAIKVLRVVSEQAPAQLYQHFDFFASLLEHENRILKWNAMLVLANLAAVDWKQKLDEILEAYLAPISGPNLIDAANVIRGSGAIVLAKPYLADRIAGRILGVERASYATPECRNIAIGHAIRALEQFFPAIEDTGTVLRFVGRQLNNSRPATRRSAEKFLKKWPIKPLRRAAAALSRR